MRANRVTASPVHGRPAPAVLLALLVTLALLVLGLAAPASASSGTPGAASSAAVPPDAPARDADPSSGTSMDGPESSWGVRAGGLSAAPAPASPVAGVAPGPHPLVAPHLLAQPQARPPTSRPEAHAAGAPGSRGPPGPAGT